MPKQPKQCPSCSANLMVTRLTCPDCGTEVSGQFPPDLFSRLPPADFDFIVLFVRTKGNIKEMERELGISYWTIRSKLNEIVEALEREQPTGSGNGGVEAQREEILALLNSGQISVTEAARLLEKLGGRP